MQTQSHRMPETEKRLWFDRVRVLHRRVGIVRDGAAKFGMDEINANRITDITSAWSGWFLAQLINCTAAESHKWPQFCNIAVRRRDEPVDRKGDGQLNHHPDHSAASADRSQQFPPIISIRPISGPRQITAFDLSSNSPTTGQAAGTVSIALPARRHPTSASPAHMTTAPAEDEAINPPGSKR